MNVFSVSRVAFQGVLTFDSVKCYVKISQVSTTCEICFDSKYCDGK